MADTSALISRTSDLFLQHPEFKDADEKTRAKVFDNLVNTLEQSGEMNRAKIQKIRDFSSQLKFAMSYKKNDFPIEYIWTGEGNIAIEATAQRMTKEEWKSKSIEEQFQLYKTHLDTQRHEELGQRLRDISAAAFDTRTYTHIAGVFKDGALAFFKNLPESMALSSTLRAKEEIEAVGALTPEVESRIVQEAQILKTKIEETEKAVTGDAYERYDALRKENPYGLDFIKNRMLDMAVAIPFGIHGAIVRRGAGATALEIGRASVAPVVSFAAQGTAFDWGFEKVASSLEQEEWFSSLTEPQKAGIRLGALVATLLVTIPVDSKVQKIIAGRTSAEVANTVAKEIASNPTITESLIQKKAEAIQSGEDVLAVVAKDEELVAAISDSAKKVGVAPEDMQSAYLKELLEEATVTKQNLQNGSGILPHQEQTAEELIEVTLPKEALTTEAQTIGTKEASARLQHAEKAAEEITNLRNALAEAETAGDVGLAAGIKTEIEQLESGIVNAVTQESKLTRLEEITQQMAADIDREQWRILAAERARLDPVWGHQTVDSMNNKQLNLETQLNNLGVQFNRKPGGSPYNSPYPRDWTFPGLENLADAEKTKADKFIEELIHNAYDRVPIIKQRNYIESAGEGVARPGAVERLPEEQIREATTVQPLPKELEMPKEADLVQPGTPEALTIETSPKSPTEQILGDIIKNKWSQQIGQPLNPTQLLNAEKRAVELMQQTFEAAEKEAVSHILPGGETIFSIAKLEQLFPLLKGVLTRAFNIPTMVTDANRALLHDGYVTSDSIYQFMENMWGQFALNDLPGWWARNREQITAADQMWELARVTLPEPKGDALGAFIDTIKKNKTLIDMSYADIDELGKLMQKVFPSFNLSMQFDKGIKGAGQLDVLMNRITLNPEQLSPQTLFHELGHYYFSHVLTSNERMAWLEALRPAIEDTAIFTTTFPNIAEKLIKADTEAAQLGSRGAQFVMYQLRPSELFAEIWSSNIMKGSIPKVDVLAATTEAQKGLQNFSLLPREHFEKLPEALKKVFSWLHFGPTPEQLTKVREHTRIALREANPFYRNAEELQTRLTEIIGNLEIQHPGISTLPPLEQLELLNPQSLQEFAEMHSLRLMHGDIASKELAELAHKKLEFHFSDNALGGRLTDTINNKKAELRAAGEAIEESTVTLETQQMVDLQEMRRYKAHLEQAQEEIHRQVYLESRLRAEEGLPPLTAAEKETIRIEFSDSVNVEFGEVPYLDEAVTSTVRQQIAAEAVRYEYLRQMHNQALAEQGLIDIVDMPYFKRHEYAMQMSEMAHDSSIAGTIKRHVLSKPIEKAFRYGTAAFLGWDQDEAGNWIINTEMLFNRVVDSPFLAFLLPGTRLGLSLAKRGAVKAGTAALGKFNLEMQAKIIENIDNFQHAFFEYKGADPVLELQRRAALREAGNIKQNVLDAAETVLYKYDKEQREIIGKIVDRTPEGLKLVTKMLTENPGLVVTADRISNMLRANIDYLVEQGILNTSEKELLTKAWVSTKDYKKALILTKNPGLRGVKFDHLRQNAPGFWTDKAGAIGKSEEGNSLFFAPQTGQILKELESRGETTLANGIKLNGYYEAGKNLLHVAPVGSSLDQVYSAHFKPYQVWDPITESKGLILDRIKAKKGVPDLFIKRNFTTAERELQGETFDIALKLAMYAQTTEKAMAKASAFSKVSNAGAEYAVNTASTRAFSIVQDPILGEVKMAPEEAKKYLLRKGWKEIRTEIDSATGVRKFGALSEHVVSPDVYKMLRSFDEPEFMKNLRNWYPLIDGYAKYAIQPFKLSKTVLNIPTHVTNFVSNGFQGFLTGRDPWNDLYHGYGMLQARRLEQKLIQAKKTGSIEQIIAADEALKKSPYAETLKQARTARIGDSSLVKSEMSFNEIHKIMEGTKPVDDAGKLSSLLYLGYGKMQRGVDFMKGLYEGEDLIYKLGGFYSDLKAGKSVEESLQSIYQTYFDYGSLPSGIAAIRDSGAVPFISYTYKAIPGMMKGIYENPHRLALAILGAEVANLMFITNDFGMRDALPARNALDTLQSAGRESRMYGIRTSIYTGHTKEKDVFGSERMVSKYFALGKYIPGGALAESYNSQAIKQGKTIWESFFGSIFNNPVLNVLYTGVAKKDPTFGTKVEDFPALAKYTWQTWAPNFPGIPYTRASANMRQAMVNLGITQPSEEYTGYTGQGLAKTWQSETLNTFTGVRMYRTDDEYEGIARLNEVKADIREAQKKMKKAISAPGLPQSAHADILKRFEERLQKDIKHLERITQATGQLSRLQNQKAERVPGLPQP